MDVSGASYILCPCCCSIHQYHADCEQPWVTACCSPKPPGRGERPPTLKCAVCDE